MAYTCPHHYKPAPIVSLTTPLPHAYTCPAPIVTLTTPPPTGLHMRRYKPAPLVRK